MKKVLLVGPIYFGINESIERALKDIGYDVQVFNFFESYPESKLNRITYGLLGKLGVNYKINRYNKKLNFDLIDAYKIYAPDNVIIIKGHKFTRDTLTEMKKSKLILWIMDSVHRVKNILETLNLYDSINVFEEEDVDYLKSKGFDVHHLPLALDQNKYFPACHKKEIDIIFIGSLYSERVSVLKKIINDFYDLRVKVYGFFPSWKIQLRYLLLKYGKYGRNFVIKKLNFNESNILYAKSHIVLNLHLNHSLSGTNLRFFEVAGTNSIQLINRKQFLEKEFEYEGLMFDSYENLKEIIKSVLSDSSKAEAIACKAFIIAKNNHTFVKRVEKLLNEKNTFDKDKLTKNSSINLNEVF